MGFWWRWQDLNLRPWVYDSPAQSKSRQFSNFFSKTIKQTIKHLLLNNLKIYIHINSEYFYKLLSMYFILKFYLKSIIFEYENFNPTILFYFIKPILKKF